MAGDTYRPGRPRPPPIADRVTFTSGGGDSYRPGPANSHPQGGGNQRSDSEFTFSSGRQGPQFPPARPEDTNASRRKNRGGRGGMENVPRGPAGDRFNAPQTSGGRRHQNGYGRGGGHRTFRKQAPHERALLQSRDDTGPEHTLGVTDGVNKFLALDDLSASESDMEIDDDHARGEDSPVDELEGNHKVARVQASTRADGDSILKWSNPDPYTALPPPDETTGKKRDFVQLIRKAKNQSAEKSATGNAVAANDDFISFGDDDNNHSEVEEVQPFVPPPPRGPRPRSPPPPPPPPPDSNTVSGSLNDVAATGALSRASRSAKRSAEAAGLPEQPQHSSRQAQNKRKRGQFEGAILPEWLAGPKDNATPWCQNRNYRDSIAKHTDWPVRRKMVALLHNEIMDFYELVQPDAHDHNVRTNLIKRIEKTIANRGILPDPGRVLCFGSFPAKLYLPTADLDLVFVTNSHYSGYGPMLSVDESKNKMNKALRSSSRFLERAGIATNVQVITRAKVPIVKFVDKDTGIRVDLSVENLTGVAAQKTFTTWKAMFPDLIYLVALVKQFLVMRGLSDVHTGGLGGFSIICLVVHHLHRDYELARQKRLDPDILNLGESFVRFLDLYGNQFDLGRQRIVMNPISMVDKSPSGDIDGRPNKPDSLSIQDPNNQYNNISGGSNRIKQIFQAFKEAHHALEDRLATLDLSGISVLETILGGNYESYHTHRQNIGQISLDKEEEQLRQLERFAQTLQLTHPVQDLQYVMTYT